MGFIFFVSKKLRNVESSNVPWEVVFQDKFPNLSDKEKLDEFTNLLNEFRKTNY